MRWPPLNRDADLPFSIATAGSASHLLVTSDAPRTLTVCAGAQDPRQELGSYKLRTAAQVASVDPEPIEDEPEGFATGVVVAGTDPEPIEDEPEGFAAGGAVAGTDPEPIEDEPELPPQVHEGEAAEKAHAGGTPGTVILVMVFLVVFVLYYFTNWKILSMIWQIG